jgi:hypothetical protein
MNILKRYSLVAIFGLLAADGASANFINPAGRGGDGSQSWAVGRIDLPATVSSAPNLQNRLVPGGLDADSGVTLPGYYRPSDNLLAWFDGSEASAFAAVNGGDSTYVFDPRTVNASGAWQPMGPGPGQPTGNIAGAVRTFLIATTVFLGLLLVDPLAPRVSLVGPDGCEKLPDRD